MSAVSTLTRFYADDFVTIQYDEAHQCIVTSRHGYPSDEKIKLSLNKSLELLKLKKSRKIISDMRGIKGTWTGSNAWIAQHWMPQAIEAGLRYVAYIYPPDVFSQFALQDLIKKNDHYTLQIFKSLEEAEAWMNEVA
ncbi:hypothetical protein SAMN05421823_101553 [Catalinimonas alkaloidigena]|uniref:SpoIIAA-like n=1 Tax=Catalinimonas alkaloidigena TaxID=1075417 RepID=A0A1G8Y2W3_9BACT|nr:hypothetical protein [Catalinimonas alkaloidigena]SDJ97136.1 hypothetical protein SAMN05421823_101553 [Catalinimonas alkaloidigena]